MKSLLKKCQFRASSFSLLHLPENGLEKNHIHLAGYLFSSNFLSRSSFFFCSFLLCCSFIYLFFWEISFSTHKLFRNSFTVLWLLLLVYSVADHNFFPPSIRLLSLSFPFCVIFILCSLEIGDNICNRHVGESNAWWVLLPEYSRQWQANQKDNAKPEQLQQ